MIDLSAVKSQKLKSLIENSIKFSMLPEEDQKETLSAMATLSAADQEAMYAPFFENANSTEGEARNSANAAMVDKIKETEMTIQKEGRKDKESLSQKADVNQQSTLLSQLNNI